MGAMTVAVESPLDAITAQCPRSLLDQPETQTTLLPNSAWPLADPAVPQSVLLTEAALNLSPFERAQLIDALWQSLDPVEQAAIEQTWLDESKDRLQAFQQG